MTRIPTQPRNAAELRFLSTTDYPIEQTQDAAITLFDLGLNVLPVPHRKKGGWPWKSFQYTRLHLSLLRAAFADYCNIAVMTGRTSGNLFVIDCETPKAFKQQGRHLRNAGIPIWSVISGGGGGHYYLRCADGEVNNIRLGEISSDVEIRGNRCYVLAPPSFHPTTGARYEWGKRDSSEPPTVHIEDIKWLPLTLATKTKTATANISHTPFSPLSRKTQDFIAHGATVGERNNRLFAAACDLQGNGYDLLTARVILTPPALDSGLSQQEIQSTLRSAYKMDREPSRKNLPPDETLKPWQRAITWAENRPWAGRTGPTDRAVFLACCERARLGSNENGVFRASVREISDISRVNKETVSKALKRLQKAQYIQYKGHDNISRATLWRLDDQTTKEMGLPYTKKPWLDNDVRVSRTDAGEWRALGRTASVVYERLRAHGRPIMQKAFAELYHFSHDQVQCACAKLAKYGMVRREPEGWVAIPVDEEWLNEHVAEKAGTMGRGEERKTQHADERAWRAASLILKKRYRDGWPGGEVEVVAEETPSGNYCCEKCGQIVFAVGGTLPEVCDFCAHAYGWKQATVWLPMSPAAQVGGNRVSEGWITTKTELVAHIEWDKTALEALLSGLTREQLTQIKDARGWAIKDHIAHLAAWERSVIAFLTGRPRHVALGISEDVYILDLVSGDVDVANEAIFRQTKNKPLEEIRSDFEAAHEELMKLVAPLDDADLQKPYSHYLPDEPGAGEGPPAINVIYGNTAHHFREHRGWIEAMLKK